MVRFSRLCCIIKKVQGFDAPVLVFTAEHYFYGHATSPLCVNFMILVSHENGKKCVLGDCTITSKTKSNIVGNFFFTPLAPSRPPPLHSENFQKTLILAFEANSVLSHENETKIVKITHSAPLDLDQGLLLIKSANHVIILLCLESKQ